LRASGIPQPNKETDIRQKYNAGLIALQRGLFLQLLNSVFRALWGFENVALCLDYRAATTT
jgi:hypothetical protein